MTDLMSDDPRRFKARAAEPIAQATEKEGTRGNSARRPREGAANDSNTYSLKRHKFSEAHSFATESSPSTGWRATYAAMGVWR